MAAPTLESHSLPPAHQNLMGVPADFAWTAEEEQKLGDLARFLHCGPLTARQLLVFFLRYIQQSKRGLAVAQLPEVLADFPVKWGYKKKRNDFFNLLRQMDFIYVKFTFRPKVRAKTYALAPSGQRLMDRLAQHAPSPPLLSRLPASDTSASAC